MTRPRVVVVAEASPMRGGIATFAENLVADTALGERFEMVLLNTARGADREGNRLVPSNVRYAVEDAWRTHRAARTADVVHLQMVADPGLSMIRTALLCLAASTGRAAVLAHSHSAIGNAGRPEFKSYGRRDLLLMRTFRRAAQILTVSSAGSRLLAETVPGVPVSMMDNAVDVASFAGRSEVPHADRAPVVVFVGVVCERKGVPELGRAVAALREEGLRFDLRVVGGQGPTPEEEYRGIEQLYGDLGLGDCLVGPLHGEELRDELRRSDVLVLPSYLEGQPLSLLEGMAAGLAVVGSRVGAVPDVIEDGVHGLVVEPGDVDGLRAALARLITDREFREQLGKAAADKVRSRHDMPHLSARMSDVYSRLVAGNRRRTP